ncbi:hypothetical protein GGS20DRAFT_394749 [Poronia punctata]|nr:hypothetical protein GGS20DRAFT_394749 [Poronia punctata]
MAGPSNTQTNANAQFTCERGHPHTHPIGSISLMVCRKHRGEWQMLARPYSGSTQQPPPLLTSSYQQQQQQLFELPMMSRKCGEDLAASAWELGSRELGLTGHRWYNFRDDYWEWDLHCQERNLNARPSAWQEEENSYVVLATPNPNTKWRDTLCGTRCSGAEYTWYPVSKVNRVQIFPEHEASSWELKLIVAELTGWTLDDGAEPDRKGGVLSMFKRLWSKRPGNKSA